MMRANITTKMATAKIFSMIAPPLSSEMIFEPYGIVASPLGKVNPSALYSFTKMSQPESVFLRIARNLHRINNVFTHFYLDIPESVQVLPTCKKRLSRAGQPLFYLT